MKVELSFDELTDIEVALQHRLSSLRSSLKYTDNEYEDGYFTRAAVRVEDLIEKVKGERAHASM